MKKLILFTAVCSLLCLTVHGQTKQQSIKDLLRIMQQDSLMQKTMQATMTAMASHSAPGQDPAAKAKVMAAMSSSMEVTTRIMKKFMDEDMVQIYDKNFSQKEINDFIAFYKSPSGQKMLSSMPAVQTDVMAIMYQKYVPLMMQEMKKKIDDLKQP